MYVFIVDIILKLYNVLDFFFFFLLLNYWLQCFVPDGRLIDGQVIQLEDGSAAYVQHVPIPKSSKYLRQQPGMRARAFKPANASAARSLSLRPSWSI